MLASLLTTSSGKIGLPYSSNMISKLIHEFQKLQDIVVIESAYRASKFLPYKDIPLRKARERSNSSVMESFYHYALITRNYKKKRQSMKKLQNTCKELFKSGGKLQ